MHYPPFSLPPRKTNYLFSWILLTFLSFFISAALRADDLEQGWANPPTNARLRAYWWWLNGNVDKQSITRDLEEMKAKGFAGAVIMDAGDEPWWGNDQAPQGLVFSTPEWREVYKHCLREAERLGLELSLNIQSGWHLGGPMIKPEQAPKRLVWSELRVRGPAKFEKALPAPPKKPELYGDLFVLAFPVKARPAGKDVFTGVKASSAQQDYPPQKAFDSDTESFWVSSGTEPGQGPAKEKPEWLQFDFSEPVAVSEILIQPRPDYGPREGEVQASDDSDTFKTIKKFTGAQKDPVSVKFNPLRARSFRVVVYKSFDPRSADSPRNVQIAEVKLTGPEQTWPGGERTRRPLQNYELKAMLKDLNFSAPDTTPLLQEYPAEAGEEDAKAADVLDLTDKFDKESGVLTWDVPEGNWEIIRFGYTLNERCRVATCSDGWKGYALDPIDAEAFKFYWDLVVEPLIADAGPLAGKTLKYLHTDSWEVEGLNWSHTLREEFQKRKGYDLLPYLPVIAGKIIDDRSSSNRFLHDYRKTVGELTIDNHFKLFREGAHKHGLLIHPESGGPHAVPIDAQRCLGYDDVPMSEFWAWSPQHRIGEANRFFVKQPASAAHTYGRPLVFAEGFTTIGLHWQETLWDNLKPAFDFAACEGSNVLVWHAFVCSPEKMGIPGQQYFAGTHLNPNTTWWPMSTPFFNYINRCQFLLQQGQFVADACYYYGDHVPNFAQLKSSNPARVLPGYDYDVVTEETMLSDMSVRDGRFTLPSGMIYRVLVLPARTAISLSVLRKVKELVAAGGTVVGPKPTAATGLVNYPQSDQEVAKLADELWADCDGKTVKQHAFGKGRVICGQTAREVLLTDSVGPDFDFQGADDKTTLDYIHRRVDQTTDIYFVINRSKRPEEVQCRFRISAKAPELWDPVSGEIRPAAAWSQAHGQTTLPLQFPPYGSCFVVFRKPAPANAGGTAQSNYLHLEPIYELSGSWKVEFDPKWGGPESTEFDKPISWTKRPEEGIRFYSGSATYRKTFDLPESVKTDGQVFLDLGEIRELAQVRLNDRDLGILWAPPFRVDVSGLLKPKDNQLEIAVVNFWPNRIIGDQSLPPERRFTKTNIRKLTKDTPLMPSGLLGPVKLLGAPEAPAK